MSREEAEINARKKQQHQDPGGNQCVVVSSGSIKDGMDLDADFAVWQAANPDLELTDWELGFDDRPLPYVYPNGVQSTIPLGDWNEEYIRNLLHAFGDEVIRVFDRRRRR
ncbi:hypothetical protein TA3x_005607 [Tundrisphaera sp. TA3]|uniref:hypothetical protein n=1 Tax=Tundrisphaera sp. TA3 TaxID=3435775 RepID=UPI003EBA0031